MAEFSQPIVAEFFAGIGLVRIGLESSGFRVLWSNDCSYDKHAMYEGHFAGSSPDHVFAFGDVAQVRGGDLPRPLALAWASFPCTDLSLAGDRAGLGGAESKTFWEFTRVLDEMGSARPGVVVLENVTGLATSHGGSDLKTVVRELNRLGYSVDVLTLDARRFVPQSRPRLFLVAAFSPPPEIAPLDDDLRPAWLRPIYADPTLRTHRAPLPKPPELLDTGLGELIEPLAVDDARWWDDRRLDGFIASLSDGQRERLALRMRSTPVWRTAYRRTRRGVPVWEIRSDDVSGCLRAVRGGSSKQAVVQVGDGEVRVRWMSPLEYARLMGAGDFALTGLRVTQALFGFGDAVCVPVVSWLAENYLLPLVGAEERMG